MVIAVLLILPLFTGIDATSRDAWAKHTDLDSYEAKWLYVDALMKVCISSSVSQGLGVYPTLGTKEVLR